jgi:adenosine deaminase
MGPESCVQTVDWAIRRKKHIIGVDLADAKDVYPIRDFAKPILKAKEAGIKVTVHSGENAPASAVIETIRTVQPARNTIVELATVLSNRPTPGTK